MTGDGGNGDVGMFAATSGWWIVGALVIVLRPGTILGWLYSGASLLWAAGLMLAGYAEHAPAGRLLTFASWYSEWFWIAGIVTMVATLFLFPTGHVLSRRWRPVLALLAVGGGVAVVYSALARYVQATENAPTVANPIGVAGVGDLESSAFAGPLAVFGWIAAGVLDGLGLGFDVFYIVPFVAIPVAAGVAILRYKLFDVDRLISKTLVYGLLTVLLGLAYVGLVLGGQALFASFTGGSSFAIAVSTLVVAALFLPVRSRVQRVVDRRFYRRRYDAQRTPEAFGARLREQVDLDEPAVALRTVVGDTMQPAHASLWLREPAR